MFGLGSCPVCIGLTETNFGVFQLLLLKFHFQLGLRYGCKMNVTPMQPQFIVDVHR